MAFRGRRFRPREESPVGRFRPNFELRNSNVSPGFRGRGRSPEFRSREEGSRLREREERRRMRWEEERRGRSRSHSRSNFRERRSRSGGRRSPSVGRLRFEPPDRPFEDEFERRRRSFSTERRPRERHLSPEWVEDIRNKYSPPGPGPSQFPADDMQEPTQNMSLGMLHQIQPNGPIETSTPIINNQGFAHNQNFGPQQNLIQPLLDNPMVSQGFPKGSGFFDDPNINDGQNLSEGGGSVIPEFNPESSKLSSYEWIRLIEETAKQRDWRKDERHYIMTSRLAGFARQWYLTTGINFKNWSEIRKGFLQVFPTEGDYHVLLEKMMARKKEENESMTQYFHHKVALLNACDIHARRAVSCIIGGLQNVELKILCKRENFEDPDTLYVFLRSRNDEPSTSKVKNQKIAEDPKKRKYCFSCKQVGHLAAQCPNKTHKCTVCKNFGHQCAQPNNKVMCGSLAQKPTHNQYFTDASIKGKVLKAYVDISSETTTIREGNAVVLNLPIRRQFKMIKGFGGASISSFGFVDVALCIDRAIANVTIQVVSDHTQAIPLVVGQSFTEQPHVVVMQDGNKMRFYQRMDNGQTNFDFAT